MTTVKSMLKRMLQSILFIIISVWVLLSLMIYFNQANFIYFPQKSLDATPESISLDYEDLTLSTSDGVDINAWWIPHPQARATLLFLHGNAGNISHRLDSINIFHQLGLSVFIIDYRGYGKSTGEPSEEGTYIDAETAWSHLINERKINSDDIIVFGRSLGGGIASQLVEKHPAAALIIESTFTSIEKIGGHYYPYLPTSLLAHIKYPSINRMPNINSPVLIIHSADDEIVPYKFGKELFEAANEPKIFLDIIGDHNYGFINSGTQYTDGLEQFITDIVKK